MVGISFVKQTVVPEGAEHARQRRSPYSTDDYEGRWTCAVSSIEGPLTSVTGVGDTLSRRTTS